MITHPTSFEAELSVEWECVKLNISKHSVQHLFQYRLGFLKS